MPDVVQRKSATAGSLDGWGWRELNFLPVSWYDGLACILTKVENTGVWPDGLLDSYIATIPETDGDATPWARGPLSVLPIVYRVWASCSYGVSLRTGSGLGFLILSSVLGVVVGRWRHGILLLLTLRKFFLVPLILIFILLLLMLLSPFDTVDRGILDRVLSSLGLPGWFRHMPRTELVRISLHSWLRWPRCIQLSHDD